MNGQPASMQANMPASIQGNMSAGLSASQPATTSAGHSPESASQGDPNRLAQVLLVRIAAGGGRESQIARDLHALVPLQPSGEVWNAQFARMMAALMAAGRVMRQGDKLLATAAGQAAAIAFLGCRKPLDQDWTAVRDVLLVAKALGLAGAPQARMKALHKIDGLSALIVESHWKLKLKGKPSASRLRTALALVALERAFGNQIKSELGAKSALSAKASRLLAGQLAKKPRDFRTDARLVTALALEAAGTKRADLAHFRLGVLGRFLAEGSAGNASAAASVPASAAMPDAPRVASPTERNHIPAAAAPAVAPATTAHPHSATVIPIRVQRPDPAGFARAVKLAAATCAEGWAGNRRAFVSAVWAEISQRHPEWGVTDIEFKAMLTEAHRLGLVVLMNADLKDKQQLATVQASAIAYKNTVWHYVRVED